MIPQILTDTYHLYKQDTETIAVWLATTARKFGFSADLQGAKPTVLKSQRLKGKARKLAKEATAQSITTGLPPVSTSSAPKRTISVKDFIMLAEYLAPKTDLKIPASVWESINRAIRLRQMHSGHHIQETKAAEVKSNERHFYFLGILERVREVLKPRLPASFAQFNDDSPVTSSQTNNTSLFENMFTVLTVEEPSNEFLNAPDAAPTVSSKESVDAVYEVEPFEDPLELYLGTAALLQDLSNIRRAIRQIWHLYAQHGTSLISAAVTTNIAIQLAQQIEEQFLKDYPSEKDTVHARNIFFGAQCILQGEKPESRLRADDPINLKLYDLIETSLLVSHILLQSFADVLRDTDLPLYKAGYFGKYDTTIDRDMLSGPQKFDEDKIILLEILGDIVFFDYINRKEGFPAADEFSRGVSLFREQHRHTLALDFAAQIHLDIQHILRAQSRMAWEDLNLYSLNSKVSLEQNIAFHENLRIDNWPKENDLVLRAILGNITRWIEHDTFTESKKKIMAKYGLPPDPAALPYSFFIRHPWLCGSMLFGMKLEMQSAGITFLNAWGSVKFAAQIYNAARKEKFLDKEWQDIEFALILYGQPAVFVGNAPSNLDDYFKRFCLSMGYSAQNFAKGGKRAHKGAIASSQGPRGVIEEGIVSPIAHELRFGYTHLHEPTGKTAPNLELVLQKCIERKHDDDEDTDIDLAIRGRISSPRSQKSYTSLEVLMLICEALHMEEPALTFDHFRLHRSAWRVLRVINDANDVDLKRIYSPMYLEKENQLPFVVGYIFMAAVNTKKVAGLLLPKKEDVIISKLLMQAALTLEGMIETGMGELEIKILKEKYGIEINIERA